MFYRVLADVFIWYWQVFLWGHGRCFYRVMAGVFIWYWQVFYRVLAGVVIG